ncbi:hypothetical protein GTQ43_27680 [Nostoc sp. KVJ3]|uniref:hypothetical protein n=1 Tax=Nostoc sp. KVJ3 TaxID=457945 RepID=UPI0022376D21|nr:hypothetical protein [Nostoc sp. KVJ3]MCW5317452.1 hypothetical protein [Nostoc sp. KVJ3]
MTDSNLTDIDIELLLIGKWRFNTDWEKISIEFKDDMTYRETKIQTFILSKPKEVITGTKFMGVWYVSERKLYLNIKSVPQSILNLQIPIFNKVSIGDMVATLGSLFLTEKYEIVKINSSNFLFLDTDKSIVGAKIT